MKQVLLTGAAGFIGSNALKYFTTCPDYNACAVIDKLTYAADASRVTKYPIDFYRFDINQANWDYILKKHNPDVIINFAAESHVDQSIDPDTLDTFIQSNYTGVGKIVHAIRRYRKKDILLVQISTDEVLGDLPIVSTDELDEFAPLKPNNPYAASKAAAEQMLFAMDRTYKDFRYIVVRATNNYGPNQHFEKFIPTVIRSVLAGKRVPVYGDGKNVREWLYVDDFVHGIKLAMDYFYLSPESNTGEIYHFGSGERLTNIGVVLDIFDIMEQPKNKLEFVTDRPGHDRKYALNAFKAHAVLEWHPHTQFKDGILSVISDIKRRYTGGK